MKEILFRGKTKEGEWVYGSYINSVVKSGVFGYITGNNIVEPKRVINKTVGQFTGLTDKNGNKVFEGDIVNVCYTEKREFCGVNFNNKFDMIEQIVYADISACYMLKMDNEGIPMYRPLHNFDTPVKIKDIEVIGNIHDNPELLEVEE